MTWLYCIISFWVTKPIFLNVSSIAGIEIWLSIHTNKMTEFQFVLTTVQDAWRFLCLKLSRVCKLAILTGHVHCEPLNINEFSKLDFWWGHSIMVRFGHHTMIEWPMANSNWLHRYLTEYIQLAEFIEFDEKIMEKLDWAHCEIYIVLVLARPPPKK